MEFDMMNLIKKRRSVRKFKEEKLSDETIQKIVKAGLLAPTSKNKKAVEFIVVDDRDTILKLKDCRSIGTIGLATSPCAIVVFADSEKSDVWAEDASIAASYIQLRAEDLGLGSVWIQMRNRTNENGSSENEVRRVLNIPKEYGVLCIIALGNKNEDIKGYTESDIDKSRVHYGKFNSDM